MTQGLMTLLWALLLVVPAPAWADGTTRLSIGIDMAAEIAAGRFDPARDAVGVRGGAAPLDWQRSVPARPAATPGRWQVELRFDGVPEGGRSIAYKFKVERAGAAADAGWEQGPNRLLALRPGDQVLERAFGSRPGKAAPRRSGQILRLPPAPSAFVGPREVQVWLPPGYDDDAMRRYPVLYLHDGQNLFDDEAAGAEWQVDETAQQLVGAGAVAPMIVVGVASTGARIHDYTPQVGRGPAGTPAGGGAAAYGRYLVQELKPAIDARFRTRAGRADTAVGGSSLGGLVSMWLVLRHADVFGAALVISPSVWWADEAVLADVAAAPQATPAPRLWLDVGLDEGPGALAGARRLRAALQARGWTPAYLEQPGASHDETAWAARVEPMLRFLYGPPARP